MRTDGPGFSLCAVPLELLGPVFQDGGRVMGFRTGACSTWEVRLYIYGGLRRVMARQGKEYAQGGIMKPRSG